MNAIRSFVFAALALAVQGSFAETKTWNGILAEGETAALASVASNWLPVGVPTAEDDIVLDGTSAVNLTWDGATEGLAQTVGSWTQTEGYTGTVVFQMNPNEAFQTFAITGDASLLGGAWTHPKNEGKSQVVWLNVSVGGSFQIGEKVKISVDLKGFSTYINEKGNNALAGPGAGNTTDGACHGGQGGFGTSPNMSTDSCYGSYRNPTTLGSSANKANYVATGGGAVILSVDGVMTHNGTISANGGGSVGSSGGSVQVRAKRLVGSGKITAIGGGSGTQNKGNGGGGRIALHLTDETLTREAYSEEWTGSISARGGSNSSSKNTAFAGAGAAGTVYVELPGEDGYGSLTLDNSGWKSKSKGVNGAAMLANTTVCKLSELSLKSCGRLGLFSGAEVQMKSFDGIVSDGDELNAIRFLGGGVLSSAQANDRLVVSGYAYEVYGAQTLAGPMRIMADGFLRVNAYGTTEGAFTVDQLRIGAVPLAAGVYDVATLAETYPMVSGAGTITVTGKGCGLLLFIR
jgi:hypothetical protein